MITVSALKQNLLNDLAPPKDISCLMLKTPLKLVKRSYNTTIFMWLMIVFVYLGCFFVLFPCKSSFSYCFKLVSNDLIQSLFSVQKPDDSNYYPDLNPWDHYDITLHRYVQRPWSLEVTRRNSILGADESI